MSGAFQADAFQNDTFQTDAVASGVVIGKRSSDFGNTWYDLVSYTSPISVDFIGVNVRNRRKSLVGGGNSLYVTEGYSDEYVYDKGVTVSGNISAITMSQEPATFIGTVSGLYLTYNFGRDVIPILNIPITDIAVGAIKFVE